ncbi:hypothetical protein PG993_000393 [Apiospora rasikravindrae]|uniref:Uncharacterized protein n=1 Tax=Apiospora rasikravindrae TaxID=990691 RepID=A0ABR1U8E8_9PEZI
MTSIEVLPSTPQCVFDPNCMQLHAYPAIISNLPRDKTDWRNTQFYANINRGGALKDNGQHHKYFVRASKVVLGHVTVEDSDLTACLV